MVDLSYHAILAQLRDKHPSCGHPISDAAYNIPLDKAALGVADMRMPYQKLEQHVAAGPSGMRNEYLRCLVGEYAQAYFGHAAVRAMLDVASMYLKIDCSACSTGSSPLPSFVPHHVKKLGQGGAQDVRPVARRHLRNFVLIHVVYLIAEKLAPRALIVHIDLRNAYNEAWRRTVIQRHIDCSPLHPVLPALMASLSTDLLLLVDDRRAPMRSEDGMQHDAMLGTTFFCAAIHPKIYEDPSTYDKGTNPAVTDFVAELLGDPDPTAAEAATLSKDALAMACIRRHLPIRLKGVGIPRMATVRDASFIGCMDDILRKVHH
eukprot:jgi/Tetstr1/459844/TSEL_005193.t1